jgi:hypothetical protein
MAMVATRVRLDARRLAVAAAMVVTGITRASAAEVHVYLDYAAWAKQPEDIRAAYIAGVFDSLVLFTVDAETARAGKFFLDCVDNAKLDSLRLSEQVRAYARPRLELQAGPSKARCCDI